MNTSMASTTPWYRQRWPWILMSLPATSVVLGFTLLYLAISSDDGLVVDDYYKQGRAIDQTIARSVRAADLGLSAELRFAAGELVVRLTANDLSEQPEELLVTLVHPTQAGFDQVLRASRDGDQLVARFAPLSAGRWLIQIEDREKQWRLRGETYLPSETVVSIQPYGT